MIEKNDPIVPSQNVDLEIVKTKKQLLFFRSLAIFFGGLIVGFVVLLAIAYAMDNQSRKNAIIKVDNEGYSPVATATDSPVTPKSTSTPVPKMVVDVGDISYLSQPKIIPALNVLNKDSLGDCVKNVSFQQTANSSGGYKLVNLIFTDSCGMGETTILHRLLVDKNNLVYRVIDPDQKYINSTYLLDALPQVNNDFSGIKSPSVLSTKLGNFTKNFMGVISFTEIKNPELLTETPYGNLYIYYTSDPGVNNDDIVSREIYLRLKDDTVVSYGVDENFFTDDRVPQVTWNDGNKNIDQFNMGPLVKCGVSINDIFLKNRFDNNNTTVAGKLASGQAIYKISSKNDGILQKIYNDYSQNGAQSITIDEFMNAHSHFLWQDILGDWHLYTSVRYSIAAECGKPVIYLYPTEDTQVSVKVAADITVSEPLYPADGWTVVAHPNGQLDYQGQSYPNLFWEGLGQGPYPNRTKEGVVVSQDKLVSTLRSQLTQLGLNDQESNDFIDFWQSKLPSTPYVRLTWLDTTDMNRLAPLQVSPAPRTTIRIFLEFEGLDKPITLKPQTLSSRPRLGFTLVEWGGLLRK